VTATPSAAQPDYAASTRQFPDDTWTGQTRAEWIEVVRKALAANPKEIRVSVIAVDALRAHLAAQQARPTHGGGQP
jgi:hypothetical protein